MSVNSVRTRVEGQVAPVSRPERLISIHATRQPIRDVVAAVAKRYGISVIVDPDVSGTVSADLNAVPVQDALQAMASPLGLRVVRHRSSFEIVRDASAPSSLSDEQTIAIHLDFAKSSPTVNTIRQIFPNLIIRPDSAANAVVATGRSSELTALRTFVQSIDVRAPDAKIVEAIVLRSVKANTVSTHLHTVYPTASFTATSERSLLVKATQTDMPSIKAAIVILDAPPIPAPPTAVASESVPLVERSPRDVARSLSTQFPRLRVSVSGSTVLISGAADEVARAKAVATSIDLPTFGKPESRIYAVKSVDATSVGELIRSSFPGVRVEVDKTLNALSVTATQDVQKRVADGLAQLDKSAVGGFDPQTGTESAYEVVALRSIMPSNGQTGGASATDIANAVTQTLQPLYPELHIVVPSGANTLIVSGGQLAMREAKRLIDTLDVVPQSVVLDTEVFEVDENSAKNLGLQFPSPALTSTFSEAPPPTGSSGAPQTFIGFLPITRTQLSLQLQLNLLVQKGNARVLADPRITTVSGRTATIRAGDTIGILTTVGGGAGTITTSQLQTFQTGVTLDITPSVTADGAVNVYLHPVVNSLSGILNGVPQISTRDAQTTVHLLDNQTLVIGGLIQESSQRTENRIPILGGIPLVGALFRNTQTSSTRNELVIVVTPHIRRPEDDSAPSNTTAATIPRALPTIPPTTRFPAHREARDVTRADAATVPRRKPDETTSTPSPALVSPTPGPTPTAFAQANVFTYGSPPTNSFARSGDPVNIAYATLSPTILTGGSVVSVSALTTTNAQRVTIGSTSGMISLTQISPGKWQASFPFNPGMFSATDSQATFNLVATRSDGATSSIQIPVSIVHK